MKKIWEYVKKRDLQDQKDRRTIICDKKLKKVFKKKSVGMFEMQKLISQHILD